MNDLPKAQININPEQYDKLICTNEYPPSGGLCKGDIFGQVYEIRKIPKFQAQTLGIQQELLIARWKCLRCGSLMALPQK